MASSRSYQMDSGVSAPIHDDTQFRVTYNSTTSFVPNPFSPVFSLSFHELDGLFGFCLYLSRLARNQ